MGDRLLKRMKMYLNQRLLLLLIIRSGHSAPGSTLNVDTTPTSTPFPSATSNSAPSSSSTPVHTTVISAIFTKDCPPAGIPYVLPCCQGQMNASSALINSPSVLLSCKPRLHLWTASTLQHAHGWRPPRGIRTKRRDSGLWRQTWFVRWHGMN